MLQPGVGSYNPYNVKPQNFFITSIKRAFRLRIDPSEVLDAERQALAVANPPVTAPTVQAFLAWRRSVLFVCAVLMLPLVIMEAVDVFSGTEEAQTALDLSDLEALGIIGFLVLVSFAGCLWGLLRLWTNWHRQRRLLAIMWAVYFLAPFLIFLYPIRSILPEGNEQLAVFVGIYGSIMGFMFLAPRAISLMPGLLRASIVAKLLFPGSSAPGWLMVLTTPIYGLLIYVVLLTPYQVTGNGLFIASMFGLIGAQIWLGRHGYALARPMTQGQALHHIQKARVGYLIANALGVLFAAIALVDLVDAFEISVITAVTILLGVYVNVLLLTLIATDFTLIALDRARGMAGDTNSAELLSQYNQNLAGFMARPQFAQPAHPPGPMQAPGPQPGMHSGPQQPAQPSGPQQPVQPSGPQQPVQPGMHSGPQQPAQPSGPQQPVQPGMHSGPQPGPPGGQPPAGQSGPQGGPHGPPQNQ